MKQPISRLIATVVALAALLLVLLGGIAVRTVQVFARLERSEVPAPRAAPAANRRPAGAACC